MRLRLGWKKEYVCQKFTIFYWLNEEQYKVTSYKLGLRIR